MSAGMAAKVGSAIEIRQWVYDKPLLWRANLYIDERRGPDDKTHDWNDIHPWVGTADDPNEWNTSLMGYKGVAGGQVVDIPSYTWPGLANEANSSLNGQGIIPRGAIQGQLVSYDYWGTDTPLDFRTKLLQQKVFLERMYNSQGVFQEDWAVNPIPTAQQWSQSHAPTMAATDYHNYVKVVDRPMKSQDDFYHKITSAQQAEIGGYPYIPGFTYWYYYRNKGVIWDVAYAAAGLDCVAFVHRAIQASQAMYTGGMQFPSGTIWQESNMTNYDGNALFNWRREPIAHDAYINRITFRAEPDITKKTQALKRIIPGDLWYYDGHVGIVLDTTSSETGAEIGIRLIESVYGTLGGIQYGGVVNYRTLADLTNGGRAWTIGRLK
jgi:hypothetical protein